MRLVDGCLHAAEPARPGPFGWQRLLLAAAVLAGIAGLLLTLSRPGPLPWQPRSRSAVALANVQATGAVAFALPPGRNAQVGGSAPKLGSVAPEITIAGLNGQPLSLSAFRGKVVLVNFWATWCEPCKQEFPVLVQAYKQYADDGLVILGVDVEESPAAVAQFAQAFGASFPVGIDGDSSVVLRYRLVGLPTSFFVDRTGVLRAEQFGPLSGTSLRKQLAAAGLQPA